MQPSGGQNDSNFFVMHNGANSVGGTNNGVNSYGYAPAAAPRGPQQQPSGQSNSNAGARVGSTTTQPHIPAESASHRPVGNTLSDFRHPLHSDHSSLLHASDDLSVEWHTLFEHTHQTASHGHAHGRGGDDWSSMADSALGGSNVGGVTDDGFDPKDLKKKVSDAQVYGPRFCVLYETFCHKNHVTMDIRRHLMSLCLENLVPFVKWARENDTQIQWIQNTLLDNDYLRPEVRNGVVIVLVYTFASIKASLDPNLDMFITLQDNDQGLGIANKFSLKIYNDPFFYLTFLKTTISALIDAGVLPDNERQNQPKRSKIAYQNREELQAFQRIQRMIVEALDSGNVVGAKALVSDVATFWQQRGKFVRNRRFAAALQVITQPRSALSPPGVADYTRPTTTTTNNNGGGVYGSGSGSGSGAPLLSVGGGGNAASSARASVASDASVARSRGSDAHDSAGPSTSNSVAAAALDPRRIDLAPDEAVAAEEGEAASSGQKRPLSALRNVSHGDYAATRYASSMNDGADDDVDDEDDEDDLDDDPDDADQPPLAKRRASPSPSAAPSSSTVASTAVASIAPQQPPPPYYIQAHQQLRNLPDQVLPRAAAMQPIRPQPPLPQPLVADAQGFIPPSAVRTSFAPSSPLPSPRVGPLGVGGLLTSSPAGPPIVWSVPALRMERVGSDRWLMKETRVFDVANFIDTVVRHQSAGSTATATATATAGGKANALTTAGSIMLIQEATLAAELASPLMELERRSAHPFGSGSVLEQELQLRGALVTSWPLDELAQFVSFLRAYQHHCRYVSDRWQQAQTAHAHGKATSTAGGAAAEDTPHDGELVSSSSSPHGQSADESAATATAAEVAVLPSLWEFWLHQGGRRGVSASGGGEVAKSVGYLVYEAPVQVVVLLRAQPTLSIPDDLWCTMYPHDFTALLADTAGHAGNAAGERRSETFGGLLIDLFPQLSHVGRDGAGASVANVTVRYLAHPPSSSTAAPTNASEGGGLPRKAPLAQYQTIGTWTHAAARLLVRLAPGPVVHDLLLECQ